MHPATAKSTSISHPLVKMKNSEERIASQAEIDLLWSLYNALPNTSPRLERTKAATQRMTKRQHKHILPPRRAFETTVDYYESALPLYIAHKRFINSFHIDNCFRSVQKALLSVLPPKLFN